MLLPHLIRLNEDETEEKLHESSLRGVPLNDVQIRLSTCEQQRIFCDNCDTSILDLHRSCQLCNFNLCLSCCKEQRAGKLLGNPNRGKFKFVNRGMKYCHGYFAAAEDTGEDVFPRAREWSLRSLKGEIFCPDEDCAMARLELTRLRAENELSNLEDQGRDLADKYDDKVSKGCDCKCKKDGVFSRMAAQRDAARDNSLFCVSADVAEREDIMRHFAKHWGKGEPVIVTGVLDTMGDEVSWDPDKMWYQKESFLDDARVIVRDCLSGCDVEATPRWFLDGYNEGHAYENGWPTLLELKDWPREQGLFKVRLPKHEEKFSASLPFQRYTNPHTGSLNLATSLPADSDKPDLGPKLNVAYGHREELGRGDSVTKLRLNIADAINVLVHTWDVYVGPEQEDTIANLKRKHRAQDMREHAMSRRKLNAESEYAPGSSKDGDSNRKRKLEERGESSSTKPCDSVDSNTRIRRKLDESSFVKGSDRGALWDIFRREDVPRLKAYLGKYHSEFRDVHCSRVNKVYNALLDETMYLTEAHKKKLRDEYGVEAWTFEQKEGEAVFIPAGCPHQVRNLSSCTKVAMDFVSPENAGPILGVTEDIRRLPANHRAKEDKLEMKRMIVHALDAAVRALERGNCSGSDKG